MIPIHPREIETIRHGENEGDFFIHQVSRTAPFEVSNHYHGNYEIYYLYSGRRNYFVRDSAYALAAGDLLFINKHDVHKSSVLGSPHHERIVVNFSDAFLGTGHPFFRPEMLQAFGRKNPHYRLKPQDQWFVEDTFRRMVEEVKRKQDGYEVSVRLLLALLLQFASRLPDEGVAVTDDPLSPTHRRIAGVVRRINAGFAEKLALETLAAEFAMSPSYLSRTFRKVTGFTLVGYVHFVRVREARRLLRETDLKIARIAEQVGYEQIAHFNRTFRSLSGMTPMRCRKLSGKGDAARPSGFKDGPG